VRDDFPQSVRKSLSHRVGLLCSNPDCRAHTTGPQTDPQKVIDVGVAAHITAASLGGPRFEPNFTDKERAGVANGIWLCQNCAKMIDNDVVRFSAMVLRDWKFTAELEAKRRVGKTNTQRRSNVREETELKRVHKLRDDLTKAMLKSNAERLKRPPLQSRLWKFAETEFIVHRLGDTSYPDVDESPGISGWFKLESFDFYHNGIEGILNIEYAVGSKLTREWASLKSRDQAGGLPPHFWMAKVFKTGKIPWRNIRHFDLRGDEYYPCPHLYCAYADHGMPYEGFAYYFINGDESRERELSSKDQVDLAALLSAGQSERLQ
jgi:hypothetical protein